MALFGRGGNVTHRLSGHATAQHHRRLDKLDALLGLGGFVSCCKDLRPVNVTVENLGAISLLHVAHLGAATLGHCQLSGGTATLLMHLVLVVGARPQAHLQLGLAVGSAHRRCARGGTITRRKRRDLLAVGADILHIATRNGFDVGQAGRAARYGLATEEGAAAACAHLLGAVGEPAARAALESSTLAHKGRALRHAIVRLASHAVCELVRRRGLRVRRVLA